MDPKKLAVNLFHRGAEADLFLEDSGPWKAVVKRRVRKAYRNRGLDDRIRRERTVREAAALNEAKKSGTSTPSVLDADPIACSITMTFVEGSLARNRLDELSYSGVQEVLHGIGRQIGMIHQIGLVHGDLTTSNIILPTRRSPFILDFGMSSFTTEAEDRGVDLHLLQRSISTSHVLSAKSSMKAVFTGYRQVLGSKEAEMSIRKLSEIAKRGRYFAIR